MAKFYGVIGYSETIETAPGVWTEGVTERNYYGDVIRNTRNLQSSGEVNDNITINNIFSIIADPYAYQNFHAMRYLNWMGTSWKISSVEVQSPRLLLTIGGVYNGDKAPAPDDSGDDSGV